MPPVASKNLNLMAGYEPLPGQGKFHQSLAPFRLYSGGFGAGKTKCGCRESIFHAVAYPGSLNLVSRYEYRPLLRTTMVSFFAECREIGLYHPKFMNYSKSDMAIYWWNDSITYLSNLENPDSFKGLELDTIYVDEGAEVPDDVYDILIPGRLRGRCGVDSSGRAAGRAWITTNPGASGWIRRSFIYDQEDGWEAFHANSTENIHNPPGYNDALLRRYKGVWYQRYVAGDWYAFEGQAFPMFDPDIHVLKENFVPNPKVHTIYEGWDFGWVNPTAVVWIAIDERGEYPPVVVGEFAESGLEPPEVARVVRDMRKQLVPGCRIESYGDPAGLQAMQNSGRDLIQEYSREGFDISYVSAKPTLRAIRLARHLDERMMTYTGETPCVLFSPRANRTIESIRGMRFRPKRTGGVDEDPQEKLVKKDDHLFDAMSYALWMVDDTDVLKRDAKPYVPHGVMLPAGVSETDYRRTRRSSVQSDYEDWQGEWS